MRPQLVAGAALAALVFSLSGCGAETRPDTTGAEPPATESTTPNVHVESVMVRQSGGISGARRVWQVTERTPSAERVFAAAGDVALEDVAVTKTPSAACCDFFVYDITIHFSDGRVLRLSASDAQPHTEPAVTRLLKAVLTADPEPVSYR